MKINIENLSVQYVMSGQGDNLTALSDINLAIDSGQFTCIIGQSGCGKTTLLNVLAGLQMPSMGSVLLNSNRIEGTGNDRAMVFQSGALIPWRTVIQNISYGLEIQKVSRAKALQRSREMCILVGLSKFENSFPAELSGGMQQRVNLARALATNPKLLLMDEPFASLDAQTRELLQTEVLRIWQQTKQTVVFATHQIEEAVFLADQVVVMASQPGRIKTIVSIQLPRPRTYEVKKSAAFHLYVDQLRDLIQYELRDNHEELDEE